MLGAPCNVLLDINVLDGSRVRFRSRNSLETSHDTLAWVLYKLIFDLGTYPKNISNSVQFNKFSKDLFCRGLKQTVIVSSYPLNYRS